MKVCGPESQVWERGDSLLEGCHFCFRVTTSDCSKKQEGGGETFSSKTQNVVCQDLTGKFGKDE